MEDTFLVVGLGSMGKRRVRDLKALGAGRVIGVDRRDDRRQEVNQLFNAETLDDFDAGLKLQPRAVIVSVPPHLHYRFCKAALEAGAAYFVECLTALTMEEIDDLVARDLTEPHHAFPSVTNLMNEHAQHSARSLQNLGKVYTVHASITSWLPKQHPWEKQIGDHYEFHRAQGGGLAEPAYQLSWICNVLKQKPISVVSRTAHVSDLPPGFNDLLDMVIELDGGTFINFHYSLCEKHDGTVGIFTRFSAAGGTVENEARRSRVYEPAKGEWEEHQTTPDWKYEDMYVLEMKHFLSALEGKEAFQGNLQIERVVIATLLAAEESSRSGRMIKIEEMSRAQRA